MKQLYIIAAVLLTGSIVLVGCGDSAYSPYGGTESPVSIKLGKSYRIRGKTYQPRYEPDYVEIGQASWYGPGFHGRKTASGERYDQEEITAAHRTLPMPSMVRVTHRETGRSIIVRINDRGPFAHGRIIDLSKGAARKLGVLRDGVAMVKVEYLPDETEQYIAQAGLPRPSWMGPAPSDASVMVASAAPAEPVASVNIAPPVPVSQGPVASPSFSASLDDTSAETTGIQPPGFSFNIVKPAQANESTGRNYQSTLPVTVFRLHLFPRRIVHVNLPAHFARLPCLRSER